MTTSPDGKSASVGEDFIGYETDYYAVRSRNSAGVKITFSGAEVVARGKTSRLDQPTLQLLNFAPDTKFMRLVYLVRESKSDHNMLILASSNKKTLDQLTAGMAANNSEVCKSSLEVACIWVPAGVAVVPEEKFRMGGHIQWRPAR